MTRAYAAGAAVEALLGPRPADMGRLWADVLREVPLFAGVPKRHVRKVAELAREARFAAESAIIRAGTPGNDFFVLVDGTARVERPGGLPPIELRPGDFFGEMALLDGQERSASVVAASDVLCLRIARTQFAAMLRKEPEIALALLRELAGRIRVLQAQLSL